MEQQSHKMEQQSHKMEQQNHKMEQQNHDQEENLKEGYYFLINSENCRVTISENWLPEEEAEELFKYLLKNIKWEKQMLKIMGKEIPEPRMTYAIGDEGLIHKYTGIERQVKVWDPFVKNIRDRIEEETEFVANSCLLNLYTNGDDYIGYHMDKETSPPHHSVVTVSLGGTRDFQLKRTDGAGDVITVPLKSGTACMMEGDTQKIWKHGIPKRKKQNDPRISLTFRDLRTN